MGARYGQIRSSNASANFSCAERGSAGPSATRGANTAVAKAESYQGKRIERTLYRAELPDGLVNWPSARQLCRPCRGYGSSHTTSWRGSSDKGSIQRIAKLDGKFVVHSNDDTLSAEDMALGYKQLMRVEQAWRDIKSVLRMRPVYHWALHRIHAHVALTFLALLLQRVAETCCDDTWRNIHDDLRQVKLVQLSGPNGQLWQVTEPRPDARKRLKMLVIENPPLILDHA